MLMISVWPRSAGRAGGRAVGVGVPLADVYLEFLGGRCRPNTVLAAAYDLKVLFTVVGKPPDQVLPDPERAPRR
jgi:integrase/recombinase XerD